jgi:uncharacterized integral membrane protein (TIGR00697 family)
MKKTNHIATKKISNLQFILTLSFVVCLIISNIISAKQMLLPFDIVMPAAVIIFPITYVLSDVFSEVYGYKWSRFTCYLGFVANLFAVIIFSITIATPAPEYWTNQEAFEVVLGNTPRMLCASLLGFVVGDFVNDRVFKRFKDKHPNDHKGFSFRAILSSFCGEMCDSMIFLPIAFLGQMPLETLATMMVCQVLIKTGYEVIILPVTHAIVKTVSKYERNNKEEYEGNVLPF